MTDVNIASSIRSHILPAATAGWLCAALLASCGCAGPWAATSKLAGSSRLALPTEGAHPTKLGAAQVEPVRDARSIPDPRSLPTSTDIVPDRLPSESDPMKLGQANGQAVKPNQLAQSEDIVIRGQSIDDMTPGSSDRFRRPMTASGPGRRGQLRLAQQDNGGGYGGGYSGNGYPGSGPATSYDNPSYGSPGYGEPAYGQSAGGPGYNGPGYQSPAYGEYDGSAVAPTGPAFQFGDDGLLGPTQNYADLEVNLRETQTGRFMFGVGVNSDLGLTAQAVLDEKHFDWRRWPRSLDDIINGSAWRGGGQHLRIEAVPGTEVQRYMVNFTQPYLMDTQVSFNLSGYLFDRRYFDWDEQRLGGRMGLGYRITPDLSISGAIRAEQVDFHNPRVRGIQIIEDALGENDLFSGKITLAHDTRDIPFAPTEGHYLELSYEQVFGSFDYPRFGVDYRRYFLLRQRADRSGRHTLGISFKGGLTGSQTPVFENYFAGGYSTMRGFRFRHASPKIQDVIVGGQLSLLNSIEYIFPITADDMLKGALFCDHGTIEESYDDIDFDDYRVAIGAGLRINVPAMGPAPIAVDFTVPLNREETDRIQNFSFFMGFGR